MTRKNLSIERGPLAFDADATNTYVPRIHATRIPTKREHRERLRALRTLAYPTPNGWGDALSTHLILDCVARLKPNTAIRAKGLTELLNSEYPQLRWDAITVGKLLASLASLAMADQVSREAPAPHFERRQDSISTYYVLYSTPDAHAWLLSLLTRAADRAVGWVETYRAGNKVPERFCDPFLAITETD